MDRPNERIQLFGPALRQFAFQGSSSRPGN